MFHGLGNSFSFLERSLESFATVKSRHIHVLEDPQPWINLRPCLCMLVCLSIHFILTENMLKSDPE